MIKTSLLSISVNLFVLLLCSPEVVRAQILNASFSSITHYHKKCTPFEEQIRTQVFETAWQGERISKAFIIWTDEENVENLKLQVSNFESPNGIIPSSSARLRSVKYVHADSEAKPCEGYSNRDSVYGQMLGDILSTSLENSIHPYCPALFWLTLDIPPTSTPGHYAGKIVITAKGQLIELYLNLQVVDYCLPPVSQWDFHLDLWQFPTAVVDRYNESHPKQAIEYWSEEHFMLLRKNYRLLGDMGQKVITAHIKDGALGSPSMVKWIKQPDQIWVYDYAVFDRYVDSLMCWGISKQISCQSPVGWNSEIIPYWDEATSTLKDLMAPVGSEIYATRWDHFLESFKKHLDAKGWFKKAVLYLDEVEPEKLVWIIEFIKTNHPNWKIGLAGFHTPSDFVSSQVHDMSLMVGTKGNPKQQENEGISTFYTSCNPVRPNNFIAGDADPAENIWMGWHAQHMGFDGFLRWAFDYWTVPDPVEQRVGSFTSGDFSLSYRSSNNLNMDIYSSIRLELLREGIEDFEKLRILKNRLKASESQENLYHYGRLMSKLDEFEATPGEFMDVDQLVRSAQQLLIEIATIPK